MMEPFAKGKEKFCVKCGFNLEETRKEEKATKKEIRNEKVLKVKMKMAIILFIILIIAVAIVTILNVFGKKSHKTMEYSILQTDKTEDKTETIGGKVEKVTELTEEEKKLDYDNDGLTNGEELEYGTNMYSSDTDGDGVNDNDEINRYKSNPTKYSTADDGISDYIKIQKDLEIDKKYDEKDVKPEEVKYSYNIMLHPKNLESQYYGGVQEFDIDKNIQSTHKIFDVLKFEGTIIYNTQNKDSILLIREGMKYKEFENYNKKLIKLRDYYISQVEEKIPNIKVNGDRTNRLPGNANISFEGIQSEELLYKLDEKGICASGGSACSTGNPSPSHVLMAIGVSSKMAKGALRVTFGIENTKEDVDYLIESLSQIVSELRK